jgi:amidase
VATAVTELLERSATELAALVRHGQVSSRELVEASLGRIDATSHLNAFVRVYPEDALAEADAIGPGDGRPFAGVPIAIKDLGAMIAGRPLTNGSDLYGEFIPRVDTFAVRRLKEAGFVIVGQTNSPELGILPVTEPRRFGATRNPWDPERTPGGSSGGSAAAVAAGAVAIAHASDGGGSIRIPAACCGLFGLKPSRNRISRGPLIGDHYLATDGVLARTVEDSARALDVLAGYEPGDANWAPPPPEPFAETARRDPPHLRVVTALSPEVEEMVDPAALAAVGDAAALLEDLGHRVENVPPQASPTAFMDPFMDLWAATTSIGVAQGAALTGRQPAPELVEPLTWWLWEKAQRLTSTAYLSSLVQLQAVARDIVAGLAGRDLMLCPALAEQPVRIGEIDGSAEDAGDRTVERAIRFTPFTALANVTGLPAMSLPLFQGDDGLPLAVQLYGPPAGEGLLLSLASQLEAARPWANRRPPV